MKEGVVIPKYGITWHCWSKKFVAKKIKTEKSYQFLRDIALETYYNAINGVKEPLPLQKRKFVTPTERPGRKRIIESTVKRSRMNKSADS